MDIERINSDAIWLLRVLIVAGAEVNTSMPNAWIQATAHEAGGLDGEELELAISYAEGKDWLDTGARLGTTTLTSAGEHAAKSCFMLGGGLSVCAHVAVHEPACGPEPPQRVTIGVADFGGIAAAPLAGPRGG
jgi:hypothetical protein